MNHDDGCFGIEDMNLYVGPWAVEFARIAHVRGHPAKSVEAVGFQCRSVLPPFEDPITLAVNASDPLVRRLGVETFGMLIVATESSVDYGKPISTYVHQCLGLPYRGSSTGPRPRSTWGSPPGPCETSRLMERSGGSRSR